MKNRKEEKYRDRGLERQRRSQSKNKNKKTLRDIRDYINNNDEYEDDFYDELGEEE